jgi:hypothetical protein
MLDVYSTPPREVLCAEMAKVRIRGAVLVQSRQQATNKTKTSDPNGIRRPEIGQFWPIRFCKRRVSMESTVARLATELAEAVLAGDQVTARRVALEVVRTTAEPDVASDRPPTAKSPEM